MAKQNKKHYYLTIEGASVVHPIVLGRDNDIYCFRTQLFEKFDAKLTKTELSELKKKLQRFIELTRQSNVVGALQYILENDLYDSKTLMKMKFRNVYKKIRDFIALIDAMILTLQDPNDHIDFIWRKELLAKYDR